jgi:hypothetical protein
MPFLFRLSPKHILSIKQLYHGLELIVAKHLSLRTSLIFNAEKNELMQRILDFNNNDKQWFTYIESTYETDEQLRDIMHNEKRNSELFDLAQGHVFRCHLVYYKEISSNDLLSDKDAIIFNFHHALFDFPSMDVFLHDLSEAYTTGQLTTNDDTVLRYLDCKHEYFLFFFRIRLSFYSSYSDAVIEQQMSMTAANMFWLDTLHDCNLDRPLPLPYDQYRLLDEHRTGRGTSVSFDFGEDLSHHFLAYSSSNNITPEQLALACYYAFLFKLTNGERDLCIGMNTHGRYKEELMSMIGMFVNAIPLRCQLDPQWSFYQLVDHVEEIITNSLEYSYFPLQRILAQHPNSTKPAFLDVSFVFQSTRDHNTENKMMIGNNQLHAIPFSIKISEDKIMSKFDFALTIHHDANINELSCTIDASLDLFNPETITKVSRQFHSMLKQLFQVTADDQMKKPIYELSLRLPDERLLMQSLNNTQVLFPAVSCIHHEFARQTMKYPQKLAVELDEQSLTYSELSHYVQILSWNLLIKQRIVPGDIICQCVERSLSMVS